DALDEPNTDEQPDALDGPRTDKPLPEAGGEVSGDGAEPADQQPDETEQPTDAEQRTDAEEPSDDPGEQPTSDSDDPSEQPTNGGSGGDIEALLAELIEPGEPDDSDLETAAAGPTEPAEIRADATTIATGPAVSGASETPVGGARLQSVLVRVAVVLVLAGAIGYSLGLARGGEEIVRREFVYTLDESVPDSFLREDRRLLTQIATLESDAVLTPVAVEFDRSVDDLRDRIDVETVDLSEVLRLDVADGDRATAAAISDAVIAQYLVVSSRPLASENNEALRDRRVQVLAGLATADAGLLAIEEARQSDAQLLTTEESLQRQIDLTDEQLNRLQGLLDSSLTSAIAASRRSTIEAELAEAGTKLTELESQLADVRAERAELAAATLAEPALVREVGRLEAELATIDEELARRELGPLVASPVRMLSEPTFISRSAHRRGLQGLAVGLLVGVPIAAAVALRARNRQLWLA
ncbi:MAG: hypothetical protein OEV40_08405, partial [Acidimicrobiia bacterium]|nr:hypothetical protein [Acidimicrobiia bacterium]